MATTKGEGEWKSGEERTGPGTATEGRCGSVEDETTMKLERKMHTENTQTDKSGNALTGRETAAYGKVRLSTEDRENDTSRGRRGSLKEGNVRSLLNGDLGGGRHSRTPARCGK